MSSSCETDYDSDDDRDSNHQTAWLTRKRKRSWLVKRHSQQSIMTSKQRPKHVAHLAKPQRLFPSCDRPLSNSRFTAEANSAEQNSSYKSMICYSDESDDEYEVEDILASRIYYRKLQYRVKWLGYKDDPEWYNASNFRNCPYRLRDFHTVNPTSPGPPKRLRRWTQCWEEDIDENDHPDDNRPQIPHIGGKIL